LRENTGDGKRYIPGAPPGLAEKNRNLRYLRFLVDLALMEIRAGNFTLEKAEKVVENFRSQALHLFPGKETAFEWIYRSRVYRGRNETVKRQ
jgi:hypothetical protein